MRRPPAGVILAAGESSRMGSPKALLPYRGTTFLEHLAGLLSRFSPERLDPVLLVLGHDADRIHQSVDLAAGVRVLVNPQYRLGQLSSLQAAVRSLAGSAATGLLVAPVDHPCIGPEVVEALLAVFAEENPEVAVPTFGGRRGHPVVFSARLFPELLEAPLEQGARAVVRRQAVREVPVSEAGILADIDDPEVYERVIGARPP